MIDILVSDDLTQFGAVFIIGVFILFLTTVIMLALDDRRIEMSINNEWDDDPTLHDDI